MTPYRTPPPAPKLPPLPWWRQLWTWLTWDHHTEMWQDLQKATARVIEREIAAWWEPFRPTDYVAVCERCNCPVDSLIAVRSINGWLSFTARCHGQTAFMQRHDLPPLEAPRILCCFRDEVEVAAPK